MKKIEREKQLFFSKNAHKNHTNKVKIRKLIRSRISNWYKYQNDIRINSVSSERAYNFKHFEIKKKAKPEYSDIIKYLSEKKNSFSPEGRPWLESGNFTIPKIFSLSDNYKESFSFLKRLFYALYLQSVEEIVLDYSKCQKLDIDASVCMDILLGEFITYYNKCNRAGHTTKMKSITPINFTAPHILKILFSIGAYQTIRGLSINFKDIEPYPLCVGNINNRLASRKREVDITNLVEYVKKCMGRMNKSLSAESEDNLFKVIGEILINAEEHSTGNQRFSIGYFQEFDENGNHFGEFNLVILNFGQTIYEKFKDPECPNQSVVEEMRALSDKFTRRGLFSSSTFEEQTLWTLYALQEGVTSKKAWRRGNGSIRFIDSFFSLAGENDSAKKSYLSIVSGNTRIIFDGTYRLVERLKGPKNHRYKIMAFNETGDLESTPDKKYVIFTDNYFPGTIITAKILLKEDNTESNQNGTF